MLLWEVRILSFHETIKAISDPTRREILDLLKKGQIPAGEIVAHFNITGASISRHLSILKDAGLVRDIKKGKFIYYEINLSVLEEILTWLTNFKEGGHNEN
jgi:ArsR family transcriptional regulator, arsenate/arsenite/antimonite-responsive transcriptional repressor